MGGGESLRSSIYFWTPEHIRGWPPGIAYLGHLSSAEWSQASFPHSHTFAIVPWFAKLPPGPSLTQNPHHLPCTSQTPLWAASTHRARFLPYPKPPLLCYCWDDTLFNLCTQVCSRTPQLQLQPCWVPLSPMFRQRCLVYSSSLCTGSRRLGKNFTAEGLRAQRFTAVMKKKKSCLQTGPQPKCLQRPEVC